MPTTRLAKSKKKHRHTVLVIETDPDNWLTLRSILAISFPEVEPVWKNHTPQALMYLKTISTNPDSIPLLIFLNPFVNTLQEGWDLLRQIKSDPLHNKIPVIVLSSSKEPEDVLQAYTLGAAAYLTQKSSYAKMLFHFHTLKKFWWETVELPSKKLR